MKKLFLSDAVKFLLAQVGSKPGKRKAVGMSLNADELPGEPWQLDSTHTVRSGIIGDIDEVAVRARQSHCVSAWRYFSQPSTKKGVLIKVGPLASEIDADSRVASLEDRMTVRIGALNQAHLISVAVELRSRSNEKYVGIEHNISRGRVAGRNFKDVAGSVGVNYFAITCSGPLDGWTWEEVLHIAELQRQKISEGELQDGCSIPRPPEA